MIISLQIDSPGYIGIWHRFLIFFDTRWDGSVSDVATNVLKFSPQNSRQDWIMLMVTDS